MSYQALLFCPDEKTARVVTQVLSDLEFSVEPCSEPFAAVKKLMAQHFDAIVVDCENEQNATLLFKSARNSGSNQSALAVAVVEGQAGVAKAFRIGANLVLTKPINVEQSKGTLRVARGLLRKADSYKPPVTATAAAPPAATNFKTARPAAPVTPKLAFSGFPAQRLVEPAVSDTTSSAFELQQDPTPEPEPTEAALLESMSDSIDSKRPAQPATTSTPSKEYPWQPVSKPLSEPMASALKRAAEAAGKTAAVAPASTKPAPPQASPTEAGKRPAAHSMPSGQGAASAPAPARETPQPSVQRVEPKQAPAAAKPSPAEPDEIETQPAVAKISAVAELAEEPLLFSAMQDQQKTFGTGGVKKIFVIAVLAMVAIAGAYYYTSQHPEIAPAFLQKFAHKQAAPGTVQTEVPVPVQAQASPPAQTPVLAPTAVAPARTSDQASNSATANWQVDTIETSEAPSRPESKPSPAKTTSALAPSTKPVNSTPAPESTVLTVAKSAPSVKTKAPAPEMVQTIAPPALGVGSGTSDKAIAGIASSAGSSMPEPPAPETLKISQGVTQGLLVKRVPPMYPQSAKQMHVQGTVQLQATIGKDGNVTSVKALSGEPVLARAAIDAVKQWKYKPYTLNSEPLEIQTQITVNFKLP